MEPAIYIIYVDLAVYAASRYSVKMLTTNFAICSFAVVGMIISFMLTFLKLQHMYGTRFFLPNRCREKKHDYWRNLQQDFDYTKIDPLQTPECSYCLEKLHVSPLSVIANCEISATKIWYLRITKGINTKYMKPKYGREYHYLCLRELLKTDLKSYLQYLDIDEFND